MARRRMRRLNLCIIVIVAIVFLTGIPFGTVVIYEEEEGTSNDEGAARCIVGPAEAFSVFKNTSSSSCSRSTPTLWTKSHGAILECAFPRCDRLLRSILKKEEPSKEYLLKMINYWTVPKAHDDKSMLGMLSNCHQFRRTVKFLDEPMTQEEADFPLAYIFLTSRNLAQTVRLFRMIYQPQNAYCIILNPSSTDEYKKAMAALTSCFKPNVYLSKKKSQNSNSSLLHSLMDCMNVLKRSRINWKYVQTVSWDEFPLKSNWEMVQIFKVLNGSQDSELFGIEYPEVATVYLSHLSVPPGGIVPYKGRYAATMSREFIDFVTTDPLALQFYHYLDGGVQFPELYYWTTLIHNIQLNPPGGFPGQCSVMYATSGLKKPSISRYQVFKRTPRKKMTLDAKRLPVEKPPPAPVCRGRFEKGECVYGLRDLEILVKRMELFARKLHEQYQPALLYCMEEWYWQLVCMQDDTNLNFGHYEGLPAVVYHNLPLEEKEVYVCDV